MPLKNACLRVLSRLTLLGMLVLTGPALCADETDPSLQWMEDLPEEKHQALKALIEQGRRRKEERQRAEAGLTAAPQVPDVQATAPKESAKENDKNMLSDAGLAERYDAITALAQDDPTDENVRQWLLAREVLKEKRVRFEEALQRLSKDGKPSGAGMGSETSNTPTPDALMPWVQWAIADREAAVLCTWRHDGSQTDCAWPGRLALSVSDDGAVFSLDWETRAPSWLELPGDGAAWPTVVQDGTQPLAVVMREGRPMTYIAKSGAQSVRLSGRLQWLKRPESIQLPAVVALSDIQIDGAPVAQNRIDDAGRLWLSAREGEADMDSAATERVEVYRLIEDGRPATVTTRIELDIGGPARALTFQNVLPEGFLPLGIRSALPASIDANGKLVLQVRRGHWSVEVSARSLREVTRLTVGVPGQTWPQEEVWAFRPDAGFRDVELSGGRAIAPEQTAIPTAWRGDRTFLMGRGEALELAALRRADGDGEADRMRLARTAWMDFDGTGITVKDLMTGSLGAPGRLEAVGALMPGRIVVDGTARQLTTLEEEAGAGVMVRRGETSIEAHGRLATPVASAFAHWPLHLPASGWNRPLQQVTMNLEVPPGWTAIEAFGADRANGLWLRQWTVMEIFLVIVSVIVIGRLYGWWLGVLALPTLVLSWHAAAAPGVLWLGFALLGALHRHLRASPLRGLWRSATTLATGLAAAAVLVSAIAFSSMAVQSALFPQLLENDIMRSAPLMRMTSDASKNVQGEAGAEASTAPGRYGDREVALQRIDPDAKIGTGPGTPRWGANRTVLHWDGPNAQATASIYLLTADQTRIANSVAALLVLSLAGFLVAAAFGRRPRPPGMPKLPRWRLPKPKWPRLK
ncbi:MAG: hypothetical protein EOM91_18355, partial [Sphingobacteriia bacterium]|nr:hypothetical protein [Sphingobacteriia bacterium]